MTLDELAQAFEVDKRTAERLRDAIGMLYDLHHASTDEDGRKRWTVQGLDELDLRPTAEERAELDHAAEQLRKAGAPGARRVAGGAGREARGGDLGQGRASPRPRS